MAAYATPLHEYYDEISSGRIVAGKWILLVYKMLVEGLENGTYSMDRLSAGKAVKFIEGFCHHCEGRNDLIRLELWQKALLYAIFGIKDKSGARQFREVVLIVARKNGKSLLAAAIQTYMAYMDGEYGAKIFDIAPKLDQAYIVFSDFWQMVSAEDELMELAKKRRTDIEIASTNTVIKPLAFNEKKSDGLNPHLVVCDEISSWPALQGLKQYEVLKSALGSRRQPLVLSCSTAGYVNDGIYDELMLRCTAVLQGSSEEKRLLPLLYMVDDQACWDDLTELKKSNPNMGVSVSEDFFREEIAVAKNSLSKKLEFLVKYCNIKQASVAAWLPYDVIEAVSQEEYALEQFRGCYCVGGIDLSQTIDLCSACIIVEKDDVLYTISHSWLPSATIDEHQEREGAPYRIWQAKGWLSPSGENYVDYPDVFNWFRTLVEDYQIYPQVVGYDRYSAQYLVQDMKTYGFKMDDVYQGYNLHPVIMEADGLLRDRKLMLGKNMLLKSHFLNAALKQNQDNRKYQLVKIDPRGHIDNAVSVIDALTVRQKWYNEIGTQLKNR